jgi:cytochrome c oxidase subunit 2
MSGGESGIRFVPPQAGTLSSQVDKLFWTVFGIDAFFVLLIAGFILFFCVRYREGSDAPRGPRSEPMALEAAWIVIPLVLCLGIYVWGARLYFAEHAAPPDALEVWVVGKQWMWKLQHGEGPREIDELHVPVGKPVKLIMTSQDVVHSFFVPAFRVKQDVLPGRYTSLWFEASRAGEFHIFCSQYCGTAHAGMIGKVVAMPPALFEAWLDEREKGALPAADEGEALFQRFGCSACHGRDGAKAPVLYGLYGRPVLLADGRTVAADEDYIREHVLDPAHPLVAGYGRLMPSFKGQIKEEQLMEIVGYLKRIGTGRPAR